MAKAKRLLKQKLKFVNLIVEILDARVPFSSMSSDLVGLTFSKPKLVLLSKFDLANEAATKCWLSYFRDVGLIALAVNLKSGQGLENFSSIAKSLLNKKKSEKIKVLVCGVPNVGKSLFINKVTEKKRAKVENRPAVTKGISWFVGKNGLEFLDTPGILCPKFDDPKVGEKLAFIGSIKDNLFDSVSLCERLLQILLKNYKNAVENRFKVDLSFTTAQEALRKIGRKRGAIIYGGKIDLNRVSNLILEEFRAGKITKITLENS
jgi:ribosome biogenesis GTPase A